MGNCLLGGNDVVSLKHQQSNNLCSSLLSRYAWRDRERPVWPDGYIIIQCMAIYNNDKMPRSIKMPKWVQKFAKYKINHPKICPKTFNYFAKVAKFHQIWSRWEQLSWVLERARCGLWEGIGMGQKRVSIKMTAQTVHRPQLKIRTRAERQKSFLGKMWKIWLQVFVVVSLTFIDVIISITLLSLSEGDFTTFLLFYIPKQLK